MKKAKTFIKAREQQKKAVAARNSAGRVIFTPEERKEFCSSLKSVLDKRLISASKLSEFIRLDRLTFKTRVEAGSLKDSEIIAIKKIFNF